MCAIAVYYLTTERSPLEGCFPLEGCIISGAHKGLRKTSDVGSLVHAQQAVKVDTSLASRPLPLLRRWPGPDCLRILQYYQ